MNRIQLLLAALVGALMPLIFDSALKGAALLAVAAFTALLLYKASAATRHLVWLVAVVALLIVPVLSVALPQWRVLPNWAKSPLPVEAQVPVATVSNTSRPSGVSAQPSPMPRPESPAPSVVPGSPVIAATPLAPATERRFVPRVSPGRTWRDWLPFAWSAGFALLALRLIAAHILLRRATRACATLTAPPDERIAVAFATAKAQLGIRQRVTLLLDEKRTIPVVWGVFRPRLLLPAEARQWSEDQLHSVLLHELAHIRRRDTLVQWLTQVACALHWWNPLVWLAAWRLHTERERACDDLVLASGIRPSAYAEHLLHVATKLSPARWTAACGLAMARKSSLEGRLLAVLSEKLNRRGVTSALAAIALLLGAGIAIPVAMLRAAEDKWDPPHAAHIGGNDFSVYCVHDAKDAAFIIAYQGSLNSTSAHDSNPKTRTWTDSGTLTVKKGNVALGFHRTHTAPDKLSLTTTPSEGRDLSKPAPAAREFGQKEYDLKNGRVFVLNDSGAICQLAINAPIIRDQETAKKFAVVIAAIPPQERAKNDLKPKHEYAQSLFRKWQAKARTDGKIPGALIWHVAKEIEGFVKEHPTDEITQKLAALLPRLDTNRDWTQAEVVALLDDITAISTAPVSWADIPLEFSSARAIQGGQALPIELKSAAWGQPAANGLRAAWLLEPRAEQYALGTVLKARVLFHNTGKEPVVFKTETWHQSDPHTARDAKGTTIKVGSTWFTGITPMATFRLAPQEYCEVNGHGIAIGAGEYQEERSVGSVGAWIEAKEGDVVSLSSTVDTTYGGWTRPSDPKDPAELWKATIAERIANEAPMPASEADRAQLIRRVTLDLLGVAPTAEEIAAFTGDIAPDALAKLTARLQAKQRIEPFSGKLPTGEIKFRVIAADPNAAKAPRSANGPGRYILGDDVHLLVSQITTDASRTNKAVIAFLSPDPKVESPHKPYEIALPDGIGTYGIVWDRSSGALWIMQKGLVRKYEFANPSQVQEMRIEPGSIINIPEHLQEALRKVFTVAGAPAQKQDALKQKGGARMQPATEQKLKWGEPSNGLRMALAWPPTLGEPELGDAQEFRLVVQNVSDAEIRLTASSATPNPRMLTMRDGSRALQAIGDEGATPGDWLLLPREVAYLRLFLSNQKASDGRTVDSLIEQDIRINPLFNLTADMSIEKAPAGAWTGKLVTGESRGSVDVIPPKNKYAQALYKSWTTAARADGKLPGAVIGALAESVKTFIKSNPTWETTPQLTKMMPPFDASHDWSGQDAAALLDELAALQDTPIKMALDHEEEGIIRTGTPLPQGLTNAPWGKPLSNGLRVAYLLEPRAPEHRLNTPLKGRILIHNGGKEPVVFRTRGWHQLGHTATDARGADMKIESTSWTTLGQLTPFRLAPGEFVELNTTGIAVGAMKNTEDWQNTGIGSWIEAKAGDDVTVSTGPVPLYDWNDKPDALGGEPRWWLDFISARLSRHLPFPVDAEARRLVLYRVALELFGTSMSTEINNAFAADTTANALASLAERLFHRPGQNAWAGPLTSAPTKFRVLPADPDAAKKPRTATNPGYYTVDGKASLQVVRRPIGERIVNEAHISFPAPAEKHDLKLPEGYGSWAAGWVRGATVMWVTQKGLLRKIDFTDPSKVQETRFEGDKTAEAPIPPEIREALRAALDVPDAPKQVYEPLNPPAAPAAAARVEKPQRLKPGAKLPDDALWKTKVPFEKLPVEITNWSPEKKGLRIGTRVVADEGWRIGGKVNVELWLHNSGTENIAFNANPGRSDVGLVISAKDSEGKNHWAENGNVEIIAIPGQCVLPAGHVAKVKDFALSFDAPGNAEKAWAAPKFRNLTPGKYQLRCVWTDAQPSESAEGAWTGELTTGEVDFVLTGSDAPAAPAVEKPKAEGANTAPAASLEAGEIVFITRKTPRPFPKFDAGDGVTMEIDERVFHGADIATTMRIRWPEKNGVVMGHDAGIASDAFANREQWVIGWVRGTKTFWHMSTGLDGKGQDFRRTSWDYLNLGKPQPVITSYLNLYPGEPIRGLDVPPALAAKFEQFLGIASPKVMDKSGGLPEVSGEWVHAAQPALPDGSLPQKMVKPTTERRWKIQFVDGDTGQQIPRIRVTLLTQKADGSHTSRVTRFVDHSPAPGIPMLSPSLSSDEFASVLCEDDNYVGGGQGILIGNIPETMKGSVKHTDPEKPLEVKLWRGERVAGRVLMPNGKPAAGLKLRVGAYIIGGWKKNVGMEDVEYSWDHGDFPNWNRHVTTDANGAFSTVVMPKLARAYVRISCEAEGAVPFETNLEVTFGSPSFSNISQQDKSKLLIQLEAGVVMTGRVLDADGVPIPRAVVMLNSFKGQEPGPSAQTDGEGRYRLIAVPALRRISIDSRPRNDRNEVISEKPRAKFEDERVTIPEGVAEFKKNFRALPAIAAEGTAEQKLPPSAAIEGGADVAPGAENAVKRATLPDDAYIKAGVPVSDMNEPITTFSGEQNGLCVGLRLEEDAEWRIGSEVKVELWVCNAGATDVKLQKIARHDIGLRVMMTGEDGKEHEATIAKVRRVPVVENLLLPVSHIVKAKEFTVVLSPPETASLTGRVGLQPQFMLGPGEYKFRCELELMRSDSLGTDGKVRTPGDDVRMGTLKSGELDVKLLAQNTVGEKALAAGQEAQPKPAKYPPVRMRDEWSAEFLALCKIVAESRGLADWKAEDLVAWGPEGDGLRSGLLIPKRGRIGERVATKFVIRNVSADAKSLRVCTSLNVLRPSVRTPEGKAIEVFKIRLTGGDALYPVTLKAGEQFEFEGPPVQFGVETDEATRQPKIPNWPVCGITTTPGNVILKFNLLNVPGPETGEVPIEVEAAKQAAVDVKEPKAPPAQSGIRGTVLKPDGTPAAGVAVRVDDGIERWKMRGGEMPDLPSAVRTAEDGTFVIPLKEGNGSAENFELFVDSTIFAPLNKKVELGGDVGVLKFSKGSVVTGDVWGLDGKGIANVGIWCKQLDWKGRGYPPTRLVKTGVDGAFSVPPIGTGRYMLQILTRDMGPAELAVAFQNPVIEVKDETPQKVEVRPMPTVNLTLDVRVLRGKAEFTDFEFYVWGMLPEQNGPWSPETSWSRQDSARLTDGKHIIAIPKGLNHVNVQARPIYMRKGDTPVFIWRRDGAEKREIAHTLKLGLVDQPRTIGISVQDAAMLKIHITGPDGKKLSNVSATGSAECEAWGTFALSDWNQSDFPDHSTREAQLPACEKAVFTVKAEGCEEVTQELGIIKAGERKEVRLKLKKAAIVEPKPASGAAAAPPAGSEPPAESGALATKLVDFDAGAVQSRLELKYAESALKRLQDLHAQKAVSASVLDEAIARVDVLRAEASGDKKQALRARLQHAEKTLQRVTELQKQHVIGAEELDKAKFAVEILKAELAGDEKAVARVRLSQAEERMRRVAELHRQKLIAEEEHEKAKLELAVAQAEMAGDKQRVTSARLEHAETKLKRISELRDQKLIGEEGFEQAKLEVELAHAELAGDESRAARARLQNAEAHLTRILALHGQKLTGDAELEKAKSEVEIARAKLSGDEARVARARLQNAEAELKRVAALHDQKLAGEEELEKARMAIEIAHAQIAAAKGADQKAAATAAAKPDDVVNVTLLSDGTPNVDGKAMSLKELETHLTQLREVKPTVSVTVAAAKDTSYAKVTEVMDAIKRSNVGTVKLSAADAKPASAAAPSVNPLRIEALRALVANRERASAVTQQAAKAGLESTSAVLKGMIELIEAKLELARAEKRTSDEPALLRELLAAQERILAETEESRKKGIATESEVLDAEQAVLRTKERLYESSSSGEQGTPKPETKAADANAAR